MADVPDQSSETVFPAASLNLGGHLGACDEGWSAGSACGRRIRSDSRRHSMRHAEGPRPRNCGHLNMWPVWAGVPAGTNLLRFGLFRERDLEAAVRNHITWQRKAVTSVA